MVEMLIRGGPGHPAAPRLHSTAEAAGRSALFVGASSSPARPVLAVSSSLESVRNAPTILAALRGAPEVARTVRAAVEAGVHATPILPPLIEAIADEHDTVTAIAAIHALGQVPGDDADAALERLLAGAVHGFAAHAAWAMPERAVSAGLMGPLAELVARGGLGGMHGQTVLVRWSRPDPEPVVDTLETVLADTVAACSRRYLVETVGLVPGRRARDLLARVASDESEPETVRAAAVGAFAERGTETLPAPFRALAREDGPVGAAVRALRAQQTLLRRGPRRLHDRGVGLKVVQVHLAAALDAEASRAGVGDTGGVATLLSRLGSSLLGQADIHEVVTIGRTHPGQPVSGTALAVATAQAAATSGGHRFDSVPLEDGEGATFAGRWPALVAAERGIRVAVLARGLPDVIHLRMADPGSLAAASVARELGIPVVFTLAPDPHLPIAAAERAGALDRRGFAAADVRSALWFRAWLVERLARTAREVVLFPRPDLRRELQELVGIDVAGGAPRYTIIAEGVDTRGADQARATVQAGRETRVIADLRRAIERLPPERQGLPIVVSLGRMHEAKGMARVVEAFALAEGPSALANLVIVGGDLDDPSAAEAAELARIEALFDRCPGLHERVILLGHRSHADAQLVLAMARHGWGTTVAPDGAYACGSLKEEFGLAIVEAMAAGLPVVAPRAGGPATYVEPGVTGMLVDTTSPAAIAVAIRSVLGLARDGTTAQRTRAVVDGRFTLERMARALAAVYRVSAGAGSLAFPVRSERSR